MIASSPVPVGDAYLKLSHPAFPTCKAFAPKLPCLPMPAMASRATLRCADNSSSMSESGFEKYGCHPAISAAECLTGTRPGPGTFDGDGARVGGGAAVPGDDTG